MVLGLLDQVGTPLQTLVLSTALLFRKSPHHPDRERLEQAVRAVSNITRRVPRLEATRGATSFDGAAELRRHA
jgi:hypothetical protein